MFYTKLDKKKIEEIKRVQAEETRFHIERHYTKIQIDMREQYAKDERILVDRLRKEYKEDLSNIICKHQKTIDNLNLVLSDKDKRIKELKNAISLIIAYVPRMTYIAQTIKSFKENNILPLITEFKEIKCIVDKADSFERAFEKGINNIKKLADD